MKNWGESADSLQCNAEIRLYDPLSTFQCYIIAMCPDDENTLYCILHTNKCTRPVATLHPLWQLEQSYNEHGEGLEIDTEYRPRQAVEILRDLINRNIMENYAS